MLCARAGRHCRWSSRWYAEILYLSLVLRCSVSTGTKSTCVNFSSGFALRRYILIPHLLLQGLSRGSRLPSRERISYCGQMDCVYCSVKSPLAPKPSQKSPDSRSCFCGSTVGPAFESSRTLCPSHQQSASQCRLGRGREVSCRM